MVFCSLQTNFEHFENSRRHDKKFVHDSYCCLLPMSVSACQRRTYYEVTAAKLENSISLSWLLTKLLQCFLKCCLYCYWRYFVLTSNISRSQQNNALMENEIFETISASWSSISSFIKSAYSFFFSIKEFLIISVI